MSWSTNSRSLIDTSHDLSAMERHILEKLLLWKDSVTSVSELRGKKATALRDGWNNSEPIRETSLFNSIFKKLEEQVAQRLLAEKMGH